MFLGGYLFFFDISIIMFCFSYLNVLYIDIDKKKKLEKQVNKDRFKDKLTYKEQLDYIRNKQEIELDKTQLFYYKIVMFLVAMYMALNTRIEPLYIFDFRLGFFSIIGIIIVISVVQTQFLKRILNVNL